ncbi:polyunsaturated fatty acid 5-lipoxygenase-like isoform X5 [Onychostoma macrolepis]|uniref:polyunsaturated fatty acid 5-lipoxygenase-like isoform X5 n=1 Tax=Onychostoma macrolepis TaxID=369639 RepID=UPI00272C44F5|nr:polyunsaturated fatty acid 5-lipoxygenase-like isoform X5 [Onychostoma macrolepis]
MSTYKVTVYTGREAIADTMNSIYLTLMDSEKQSSERTLVNHLSSTFEKEFSLDIQVKKKIGNIVQVKLKKEKHLVNYPWFCKHIKVQSPSGDCFEFPCYCWLVDENELMIREGTARLPQDDTKSFQEQRKDELESRQKIFRGVYLGLEKFVGLFESWKGIADFEKILEYLGTLGHKTAVLENVMQDWNKDYMFGYQFLNGCNPVMIRKCMQLPDKFPVTHEMVEGSLKRGHTLQEELQAGNIYIADYEILKDVPAASKRYLTAPICLLYKNDLNQIVPIAIQLSQTPGEMSPIFLPSDNEYDWMLAKMWVKSSDFNVHQLVTHLLKTHLVSEVFEIAMYRQLSSVHPVYKLLMPHVRFTIAINAEAREKLISKNGIFSKVGSISVDGMGTLMQNGMTLTYKSLCFPEEIKARGMEDVPKYYYRDDGMRIWEAINCFVFAVVKIYYDSDEKVQQDEEIQGFVKDVACFGMNNSDRAAGRDRTRECGCPSLWWWCFLKGSSGLLSARGFSADFPKSLESREQLVEYLTVVIFTASAQHAAVNFGQFDWYAWIPNSPSTMRKPPPQKKGQVDMKHIMQSLPDRDCSSTVLGTVWALSQIQENERFLGKYPDVYFTEQPVKEAINTFCHKLQEVTNIIKSRNEELTLAYCYLSPDKIPNSVAI